MSLVRVVVALWGGMFVIVGMMKLPGDGDLYWQRWLGESLLQTHRLPTALGAETFTAQGATWVPQEWLFSLAVALAANLHVWPLLVFIVTLLPVGILISIYVRARDAASPEAIGVALLFCGVALAESFGPRAQVLGWAALAAFFFFLERKDRWQYAAIPTAIVWANLHASVLIAPAIVLARIAGSVADGGWRALRGGREVALLAGVALATLCTPFGWRLPALAVALSSSPIRHFIQEWQAPGLGDLSFVAGALPLALAVLAGGRVTLWNDSRRSFPAILLFVAMLFAGRNVPLFAIAAAPLAAVGLDARVPRLRAIGSKIREMELVALLAIFVVTVLSGADVAATEYRGPSRLPVGAIASLDDGTAHRVFCQNFTWCSLALSHSKLRVFIDGRCEAYPLNVWADYVETATDGKSWSRPLERYAVDTVIAGQKSQLASALEAGTGWRRTYHDGTYVVLTRD